MTVNLKLLTVQIVGMFVVFAFALFFAAGTIAWSAQISCLGRGTVLAWD